MFVTRKSGGCQHDAPTHIRAVGEQYLNTRLQCRPRGHHIVHHDQGPGWDRVEEDIALQVPPSPGFTERALIGGVLRQPKHIVHGPAAEAADSGHRVAAAVTSRGRPRRGGG